MKKIFKLILILILGVLIAITASLITGRKTPAKLTTTSGPLSDTNFKIEANKETKRGLRAADRFVEVFGLRIYAFPKVSNTKLLYAGNILAQYIDNNEDSVIDNPELHKKLKERRDLVYIRSVSDKRLIRLQDLGDYETIPEWHIDKTKRFDASLEEIWHALTHQGYGKLYPQDLAEVEGTRLTNAMDIARGGKFKKPPAKYPDKAWYTYEDKTCDYTCMAGEYIYWLMLTNLGAQETRKNEISNEWKIYTKDQLKQIDVKGYELVNDPKFRFPTKLPNGKYKSNKK